MEPESNSVHSKVLNPTESKKENVFLSLIFNIAIPTYILLKLGKQLDLSAQVVLLIALAFPIVYGTYDYWARRQHNLVSILGFASILLNGVLGLLQLDGIWFASKDAIIPSTIGLFILITAKNKKSLIKALLLNDSLMNSKKIDECLQQRNTVNEFEQMLLRANQALAGTFFLSALIKFLLVYHLLKSPAGTTGFNTELGQITLLSWPFVVLPNMLLMTAIFMYLLRNIKSLTGLSQDEIFHQG